MSEVYRYNSFDEAMEAVTWGGWNLEYVRPDLQTPEMALEAVKDGRWAFEYVRPDLITPELALRAVKEWGLNLKFVPAHCQTQEVIEVALKSEPDAKSFIKIKGIFKNALEEALDE